MRGGLTRAAALALALFTLGCDAELRSGLSETQADAIVLALDEASIASDKERERGAGTYRVVVARGALTPALAVLEERDLPREEPPGLDSLFERGGLLESPDAERARYGAALGAELARSIESIDGVERARVHLAIAPRTGAQLDAPPPASRASVLVHARRGARLDDDAVRRLVVGSLSGLDAENVEVVRVEATPPREREARLARVGPFAVSAADAPTLKAALAATLSLNLLLALFIVALVRRRRAEASPVEGTPTTET